MDNKLIVLPVQLLSFQTRGDKHIHHSLVVRIVFHVQEREFEFFQKEQSSHFLSDCYKGVL